MPYFAGLRGTGNFGTDERPKSFREMILWMQPNGMAPLFALTSKAKTESVNDPEYSWWEETLNICRVRVNNAGGYNDSATAITVDSGALELIEGDLLMVEPATESATLSAEVIRVTAQPTVDTAIPTVARGAAGTTAASIPDDAYLLRVGNAHGEGTRSPGSASTNPTKFSNYTQIFKTPYQITKTGLATNYRTGDPRKNEQKRKSFQHAEKIEQALFWGRPSETTVNNQPLRTTRGIRSFITSNNTVFATSPDEDMLIDALAPMFDYDAGSAGNERLAFCGNGALLSLGKMVRDGGAAQIQYDGPVKFYGMDFQKYILPMGTVYFKSHPLMNVHPTYKYSMFCLPGNGVIYRPLKGRDTHVENNIQENDADYIKDQWLTECGFEFHFEKTWAYIGNFRR